MGRLRPRRVPAQRGGEVGPAHRAGLVRDPAPRRDARAPGTAVLVGAAGLAVLLAGGARLRHAALLVPAAALAVAGALVQSPYRLDRLRAFLDPYGDPQGVGYHMIQSMSAVSGGGLAGRGLGNSIQKFGYLPEDTTDFIFAIICEELGIVGAGLVICLYAMLCLCALSIIRRTTDRFAQLLAIGIVATIGLQALINLAVVTGCGPTKGIALPLISSGGTGWVLTAFCLGLLVSIGRRATDPPADPEAATAPTPPAGTHRLTAAA
ncbi:MAG: FtsW/RodA/SpoVE family cell cycle protein [Planctomycetota bacterium]